MNTTLATLLAVLAVPLVGALIYATVAAGAGLRSWLAARSSTSLVAREALVLEDLAMGVVQDIEVTEKAALENRTPGPLTVEDARQLKALAITRLKAILEARGIDTLKALLGAITSNPVALDQVLSGKVEQAVAKVSAGAAFSAITAAAAPAAFSPPK